MTSSTPPTTHYPPLDAILGQAQQDEKAARKALRHLAPTLPDEAPVQLALGLTYLSFEQPRDALRALKRAVELDPGDVLARYHLGTVQTDSGLLPQGEENLRLAAAAEPENADYQAALGFNFYKANKQTEAIKVLEAAAAAGSEDGDVFASLGYLYYFGKRLADARDAFGRAITLKPDYAEVYNNRGYLGILLGDLAAAQTDLAACVALDADFLRARFNQALATWLQGDHEAAKERYRLARLQDRGDAELRQHLDDFDEISAAWPADASLKELRLDLAVAKKAGRR